MPHLATTDNVDLYYEDVGRENADESGSPVVFLHGWTCNRRFFADQVATLREDRRVVTLDLRGHGDSGRPQQGLTMERLAADVRELVEYLDLAPATVVGWSMGAHVLFEYVDWFGCDDLERAVVVDMTPKLLTDGEWDLGLYGEFGHEDNMETLATMTPGWDRVAGDVFRELLQTLDEERLEWVIEESEKTPTNVAVNLWVAMAAADYRSTLSQVEVPTLVAYGEESKLYSPETSEYMAEEIPDSELVGLEGVGHGVPVGSPDRLAEEIAAFVDG